MPATASLASHFADSESAAGELPSQSATRVMMSDMDEYGFSLNPSGGNGLWTETQLSFATN